MVSACTHKATIAAIRSESFIVKTVVSGVNVGYNELRNDEEKDYTKIANQIQRSNGFGGATSHSTRGPTSVLYS